MTVLAHRLFVALSGRRAFDLAEMNYAPSGGDGA